MRTNLLNVNLRNRKILAMGVLMAIGAILRIVPALHTGLWVDEIFSLAMATGHSLEHPASQANPALGDYVESPGPQPAEAFRAYMRHDPSPAGISRVVRAVQLSDTSPPLYYLALNVWTRMAGTSDAALRLFSVACGIACFPLFWFLGLKLGDERTAWAACIFFAFSPVAIYYSAEGRMYALTWLAALLVAAATVALSNRGPQPLLLIVWVLGASLGLLTHYFVAFVVAACLAWLIFYRGKLSPLHIGGLILATAAVVSPWFLQMPHTFSNWRVTAGWLNHPLSFQHVFSNPVRLVWSYLTGSGVWGASNKIVFLEIGFFLLLAMWAYRLAGWKIAGKRWNLLWLWLLGSITGPVIFDIVLGSYSSSIARYALPGLPAALLLVAMMTSILPRKAYWAALVVLPILWLPGIRLVYREPSRAWEAFPQTSAYVATHSQSDDLIIISSIPSGVLGVARYLNKANPIVSWVEPLKQRQMPGDIYGLLAGRSKVVSVNIHEIEEASKSPAQDWLLKHWTLEHTAPKDVSGRILFFAIGTR